MRRPIRFIPENKTGVLVEVSSRTVNAWALLRPSPELTEVTVGVLGRALEVSPLEVVALSCLSNHYHALLVVDDQQQLSRFMQHFQSNLSKEVGRIVGWKGPLWSRRYDGIVVSDQRQMQWERLKYVLQQGVKEELVESPLEWPGVHAARALVEGKPLEGYWFNRTREWAAGRRREEYGTYDYATRYEVELSPLPAFRDLSPEAYREKVTELVREIEEEGERDRDGRPVAGVAKILSQDRFKAPSTTTNKSPRKRFHVKGKKARAELWAELTRYVAQYREASEALRSGDLEAASRFPAGSYPPALAFVGNRPAPPPAAPPTRRITKSESGIVERDEIPVVTIPGRWSAAEPEEPRARGQPP
jgi:hypothetical protein